MCEKLKIFVYLIRKNKLTLKQQERLNKLSGLEERYLECSIDEWDEVSNSSHVNITANNRYPGRIVKYLSKRHKDNIEVGRLIIGGCLKDIIDDSSEKLLEGRLFEDEGGGGCKF